MRVRSAAIRAVLSAGLLGPLLGCGQGLFTRSRANGETDGSSADSVVSTGDVLVDTTSPDGGVADASEDTALARSMTIAAGADGVLTLEQGIVTVRSMSFEQDVSVTIEIADSPTLGPIGRSYRASLLPAGAHSRNAIQLAVQLDAVTDPIHDQFRLATYQARSPVGLWTSAPGQTYVAASQTLAADFTGLDKESILFALLRTCANSGACLSTETCNANLCQ